MANRPSIPAKEIVGTAEAMNDFTRRILAVPHAKIKAALEAEKRTRTKRSASRVSASSPKRAS